MNTVGSPPYAVNGFRFSVYNGGAAPITARARVRFYQPNATNTGPGTIIAPVTFNPIAFPTGVTVFSAAGGGAATFTIPGTQNVWIGITFDDSDGAGGNTGATVADLNNLGVGFFNPPDRGSSLDRAFLTTTNGGFNSDNPPGALFDTPAIVDNFGYEILVASTPTAGGVTLSGRVTVPDGRGITNAVLTLTDPEGVSRTALTDRRGRFNFDDVPSGRTYVITVSARRYVFDQPSQVITVNDNATDLSFTASSLGH